jgi:hypothetical protein
LSSDQPPSSRQPATLHGFGTFQATGEVVGLGRRADRVRFTVAEQIALGDADLRQWMARRVGWTFFGLNIVTLAALGLLVALDDINISSHLISPADRIITSGVIMALLGATTVQLGTIAVIIARYLFPGRSE